MTIITIFIIPFCFGFITGRAFKNKDVVTAALAIIGFIADLALLALLILTKR